MSRITLRVLYGGKGREREVVKGRLREGGSEREVD
jgi:hypothetical protein